MLNRDFKEFAELLNAAGVDYLVVGGYALAAHGHPRYTGDIDAGALPDAPHHAVLVRPDRPAEVYVCSDAGVYVTADGGAKWLNASGNLPNTMVVDLAYQAASKTLVAATYGRSIWALKLV